MAIIPFAAQVSSNRQALNPSDVVPEGPSADDSKRTANLRETKGQRPLSWLSTPNGNSSYAYSVSCFDTNSDSSAFHSDFSPDFFIK